MALRALVNYFFEMEFFSILCIADNIELRRSIREYQRKMPLKINNEDCILTLFSTCGNIQNGFFAILGREVAVEAVVRIYSSQYVILKFSKTLQENIYVGVSS